MGACVIKACCSGRDYSGKRPKWLYFLSARLSDWPLPNTNGDAMNIQLIPHDAIGLTHEGVHMIVWFAGGEFHATDFEFVAAARRMRTACQTLCDVRDAVKEQRRFIRAVPSLN